MNGARRWPNGSTGRGEPVDWATDVSRRIRVGGEFARRRIDAKFRRYLKSIGWRSRQRTVVAFDDDPIGDVMETVVAHWTG
jgi:hypothetical protein